LRKEFWTEGDWKRYTKTRGLKYKIVVYLGPKGEMRTFQLYSEPCAPAHPQTRHHLEKPSRRDGEKGSFVLLSKLFDRDQGGLVKIDYVLENPGAPQSGNLERTRPRGLKQEKVALAEPEGDPWKPWAGDARRGEPDKGERRRHSTTCRAWGRVESEGSSGSAELLCVRLMTVCPGKKCAERQPGL